MEPKFLRDYVIRAKEYIEKVYPHKDIAEYTRLIDALDAFIKYGIWSDLDLTTSEKALNFIQRLASEGGQIVSSGECSVHEISSAQCQKRFFVDDSNFGYVLRPKPT